MSKLLLNLRNVPDDEADEVRTLLREEGIEFYETQAGRWRLSLAGIWVKQDADYPRAKLCFDAYQRERTERVRAEHAAARARGEMPTVLDNLRENPTGVLLAVAVIIGLLALMLWPWWRLA